MVNNILIAARECIGTPFKHQGRNVGVGLDCAGVLVHVANRLGIPHTDVIGYGRVPAKLQLKQVLDNQQSLKRVGLEDKKAGDILLMTFVKEPQHIAIYTGDTVIHAYERAGKCCEHRLCKMWESRILCVYRFEGV